MSEKTIEDLVKHWRFRPNEKELFLAQARRVEELMKSKLPKGEEVSLENIVTETLAVESERMEPTVLLSESDPEMAKRYSELLQREHLRVIENPTVDAVARYIDSRKSGLFYLVSVICGMRSADPKLKAELIEHKLLPDVQGPCFVFIDSAEKDVVIRTRMGEFNSGIIPREYAVIERVHDNMRGLRRSSYEDSQTQTVGYLELVLARVDDPIKRKPILVELAQRYRQDRLHWVQAVAAYKELLDIDPMDSSSMANLADLLLRRSMRYVHLKEFRFEEKQGLDALVMFLENAAEKRIELPTKDYLLGKAAVLQHLQAAVPITCYSGESVCERKQSAFLEQGINSLLRALHKKPHNFDAQAYLALAYVLRNGAVDRENAYEMIEAAITKSDPVTELLQEGSEFETELPGAAEEIFGTRLLQYLGLHRVLDLGSCVVKAVERTSSDEAFNKIGRRRYETFGDARRAEIEVANIAHFNRTSNELFVEINGKKVQIKVPRWNYLISSERHDAPFVFEVMEFLPGTTLATKFENLDECEDKEITDSTKIAYLEIVADASVKLQEVASTQQTIGDVRTKKYKVKGLDGEYETGYYRSRFEILVNTLERFAPAGVFRTPSTKQRRQLVHGFEAVENFLLNVPDWFYIFNSDSNLRNFKVQGAIDAFDPASKQAVTESEFVLGRVDFETAERRLCFEDIITATEHELAVMHTCAAKTDAADYLLYRWLGGLLIRQRPDGVSETAQADFTRSISLAKSASSWQERYAKEKPAVVKYISQGLGYSASNLEKTIAQARMLRHLAHACEKIREHALVSSSVLNFEKKYEAHNLRSWVPQGRSFKHEVRMLEQADVEPGESDYAVRLVYARLRHLLEDSTKSKEHHLQQFRRAAKNAQCPQLVSSLRNCYPSLFNSSKQ